VLRFRLRKMVPFDVEHSGLSYQMLVETKTECKVLAAIIPGPILAEYEGVVRAAGYEPGAVLPSGLAALEAIESMEAMLIANLSPLALTTSITNGRDLLLYRTLDLPEDPGQRLAEVQRGIAVAAAYFEDKLLVKPRQLYFAGVGETADFGAWLENQDMTVVDLAPKPETGAATALGSANIAGVVGALAGVS
jgi:type IV pilus assembly protein PilM